MISNGGLGDLKFSADTLDEANIIVKKHNDEYISFYDCHSGEDVDIHQFSWYPAQ